MYHLTEIVKLLGAQVWPSVDREGDSCPADLAGLFGRTDVKVLCELQSTGHM